MAYKTVATRWLLSKKDLLKVSFAEHKDTHNLLPNLTDIEVKISIGSLTFSGRGTDLVGDIALEKASSEAIERWCCHKLEISTVGCAIRSTEEDAKSNSVSEFIERFYFDQFLEHSFHSPRLKTESIGPEAQINYYELTRTKCGSVILSLVVDSKKPVCLGLALEKELKDGFTKSSIEALRNYAVYKENKSSFFEAVSNEPNLWCCDPEILGKIYNKISALRTISDSFIEIPKFKSSTQSVSSILGIGDCPLFLSRTNAVGNI